MFQKIKSINNLLFYSKLSFLTNYTIKAVEKTISLNNDYETLQLLTKEAIKHYKEQKYSFIHIGLVQVVIKPLTRSGLNTSVLLCLRDGRYYNFHDSLLGMVESSLFEGPVYFNCYPNYSLSLFDTNILHSLILNNKTNGYHMMKGSYPLTIVYRIHYKLMKTTLEPQALITSPKGYTLLLQSST